MSDATSQKTNPQGMKLDCDGVRRLLDPYLDNELSAEDIAAVEDHLANCRKCAYESTQMIRLKEVINRWRGPESSDRLHRDVMDRVRDELTRSGPPLERYYRRLALAATAAVLVVLGLGVTGYYLAVAGGVSVPGIMRHERPEEQAGAMTPPDVIAIVEDLSGGGAQAIRSDGRIHELEMPSSLKPGEIVEVTEDATAAVRVAGGRLLLGALSWQGKVPRSAPLSGLTRMRFASPETAYDLERGTVRITASGKGMGAIRIKTPAGIVYVPWEKMGNEHTRAVVHVAEGVVAVGVLAGEAGILRETDAVSRNIPVHKGDLLELSLAPGEGQETDR